VSGEFHGQKDLPQYGYSFANGIYMDLQEAYSVHVKDSGQLPIEVTVQSTGGEEYYTQVFNQPVITGAGINESLALSDEKASLPETVEDIEAYARYTINHSDAEEGLIHYDGPTLVDMLE
jgi:hypothetical protein